MRRIGDEKFIRLRPDADKVVAVRIKDGEFYFLAWMENASHYRIKQAMDPDGYLMDREALIADGDIFSCVQCTEGYNNMYVLYGLDDDGTVVYGEDRLYINEYEKFLSLISNYERNGKQDANDHDIFLLTTDELSGICDALRDGGYVFVVED